MKSIKLLSAVTLVLFSQVAFSGEKTGEELYQSICSACHGMNGGMDMDKRIAPPIGAVRMHYMNVYSDKDAFIGAVSNWVETRDENISLMRGAIMKFKVMPPISVPKDDVEKIAAYIYDGNIEELEGFEEHVEEEHGKHGMNHDNKKHNGMGRKMMRKKGMHKKGMAE